VLRSIFFLSLVLAGAARAGEPVRSVEVAHPRAYGYHIGDVLRIEATLVPEAGLRLAPRALPKPGRIGTWLALHALQVEDGPAGGRVTLRLDYQAINAPPQVRTVSLPPFDVPLTDGKADYKVTLPPWWFTIGPLTPDRVLGRDDLPELRADAPAPPVDTGPLEGRLRAWAAAALLPLAVLAYAWLPLHRLVRRRLPFSRALGEVRRLRRCPAADYWPAALQAAHRAFDATAGAAVFADGLEDFLARHPRFLPHAGEMRHFFALSRQVFFHAGTAPQEDDRRRLERLLRRCRDVERGLA
jgi:mxaA protein